MALPLSWSSDLERPLRSAAPNLTPAAVLARIEAGLQRHHASVQRGETTLRFRAGPLRALFSWSLLHAISDGAISVEEGTGRLRVLYEIRFSALFRCAVLFAAGAVLWEVQSGSGVSNQLLVVLLLIALAYTASIALAVARFFTFLSGILDRAAAQERADDG